MPPGPASAQPWNRQLCLPAVAQGLFLTNNVVFIAINGLVGFKLAPAGWMATLPVMGYVVGGALSTGIVARVQQRWGRKVSFQIGLVVAPVSALGFFTGQLIRRYGVARIMAIGVLLNAGGIAVALSGQDLQHFIIALFLLGVGWNFLFTGSTTLAMQAYRPEEKNRAQAAINFCVFATLAVTSFASGALVTTRGWTWLNLGSMLPVALAGLALPWLRRRTAAPLPAA